MRHLEIRLPEKNMGYELCRNNDGITITVHGDGTLHAWFRSGHHTVIKPNEDMKIHEAT